MKRLILCALALSVPLSPQGISTVRAPAAPRPSSSGRPFGARFTEVGLAAGLVAKSTDAATHRYIIEANGTGVALVDYDHDGLLDAFLIDRLYRNLGNGKFADVTSAAGVVRRPGGNGVCAGDFDGNGFVDLYVTYLGANRLYRNTASKLVDVAVAAGVAGDGQAWSTGCTFLDYDRDGHLDLFVNSYLEFDQTAVALPGTGANCQFQGKPVFCGPRGLPHGRAWLYHNRGDGTFEDVSVRTKIAEATGFYGFTAVAADLTGDGWVDVYVAADSTPSLLLRNNRDGTFSEIGAETGVAFNENGQEQAGMGVAVGDADGDGLMDLVKTNFSGDHLNLFRNLGQSIFEDRVVQSGLGVNPQYVAWGVGFADFDNDGWQDLIQVNGHVYPEFAYRNPRLLYRNLGGGKFEDMSDVLGVKKYSSRGAAFGDFDNDGDVDVLVMNMGEAPSLLRNDLARGSHWVRISLVGIAIGAQVTVEGGGRSQRQVVLSQSSFLSQSDLRLHFGLGKSARVDAVTVVWPDGRTEKFAGFVADQTVVLTQGAGR